MKALSFKLNFYNILLTGAYLQSKLPLQNSVLRCVSALDPTARGHSSFSKAMKKLPGLVTSRLTEEEKDGFDLEVHR